MQKFILVTLILGLAFFIYLLKTGEINQDSFKLSRLKGDTSFEIRKSTSGLSDNSSDIFAIVKNNEYKIFTFSGDDFHNLTKAQYALPEYKVPLEASDAVSGTWLGNRYVFYIVIKENTYEIYKAEYSTDDISKLSYTKIKTIQNQDVDNSIEVTY